MEAARRGEPEAWERIYDNLGHHLTRYAASRGITDPEDVTQEVMYAAVQRIDRFDGDWENLRSWLFTIAYRRCADHHRRRARSPEQLTQLPPETPDFATCADGRLWADGEAREAFSALAILGKREREIVTLRVIDEMTTRGVADATGLSTSNVRVIQSRALAKLRRYLEANGGYLDKRFRTIFFPAVVALEKLRLLPRLGSKAEEWLTGGRFGKPMETLRGTAAVPGGMPQVLAAGTIAAAVAVGGLNPGIPSDQRARDAAHHAGPPAISVAAGNRTVQKDDRGEIDIPGAGPAAGDFSDRPPAVVIGRAGESAATSSPGIGRLEDPVADVEAASELTTAVEHEIPSVDPDPITENTEGPIAKASTHIVNEASDTVIDGRAMEPDDDTIALQETGEAVAETSDDDADAGLTDPEPDSLLEG